MLALAGGFGFSFAVVALPFADIGDYGWRIPYVAGRAHGLPRGAHRTHLAETTRTQVAGAARDLSRGRLRELLDPRYGRRFALLAIVGFLANVFNAPSSQLMNKYLSDVRDFSNSGIALFRTVTTALPGLIGLVMGGRLAEQRGRKPVAIVALSIATVDPDGVLPLRRHPALDHLGGIRPHLRRGRDRARHPRRGAVPHRGCAARRTRCS